MIFDIAHIDIKHTNESGYEIFGVVNGKNVTVFTDDEFAYFLLEDNDPEMQEHAVRYCETKLMEAYLEL